MGAGSGTFYILLEGVYIHGVYAPIQVLFIWQLYRCIVYTHRYTQYIVTIVDMHAVPSVKGLIWAGGG